MLHSYSPKPSHVNNWETLIKDYRSKMLLTEHLLELSSTSATDDVDPNLSSESNFVILL
ncbi:hypothetical protein HanRHA438_Chr02g0092081 [Helianthus annuus]|nr:hypothetical protein HanRHA438_Chr02g0092081 [Helianthus annuus]